MPDEYIAGQASAAQRSTFAPAQMKIRFEQEERKDG